MSAVSGPLLTLVQLKRLQDLVPLALSRWGHSAQLRQLAEEASELAAQVNRHERGRDPTSVRLAEEAGDLIVMLVQLSAILDADQLRNAVDVSIEKLAAKLQGWVL